MRRSYWIAIVVLGALVLSATVGWATTVYWRNGRYQLPGSCQSRVLDSILTDHKRDINTLLATNTSGLSAHVSNTTSAHSYDARYTRQSESSLRILRGRVYPAGTVASGSGFTVTHTVGTGVYTINYSASFSGWAVPVITPLNPALVDWTSIGAGNCIFTLRDTGGTAIDEDFSFIIAGN